jgi:Leucine-rich repeat (LRR) protein
MRPRSSSTCLACLGWASLLALAAGCTHPADKVRREKGTVGAVKDSSTHSVSASRARETFDPKEAAIIESVERRGGRVGFDKRTGRVVAVDLSSCPNASNDLVDRLGALPALERLDLSGTALKDGWMSEVTACKKIRHLALRGTELTDDGLKQLARLPELRTLNLAETRLTAEGLRHLAGLKRLEWLHLGGVAMNEAGFDHLAALPGLRTLSLSDCCLTEEALTHLARLEGLRSLDLSGAKLVETWESGMRPSATRKLSAEALVHLGMLQQLHSLNLARTQITDEGLRHLANMTHLKRLDLSEGWSDDEAVTVRGMSALVRLDQLEWLNLAGTAVNDEGIKQLSVLRKLRALGVRDSDVTGTGLEMLPALVRLDFGSSRTTRKQVQGISRLKRLRALNLAAVPVEPVWLKELGGLIQLEELTLDRVVFLEGGIERLAGFPRLRRLILSGVAVPITDENLTALAAVTALREVVILGGHRLPRRTIDRLSKVRPDVHVALTRTRLEAND